MSKRTPWPLPLLAGLVLPAVLRAAPQAVLVLQTGHANSVTSISWSPDGKWMATGSVDRTAVVWDAQSGEKMLNLRGHLENVSSVAWSPDGKRLATGSWDHTAQVWDAQNGEKLLNLRGHSDKVVSVSWSPDGKRLATGSFDRTTQVWDMQTGEKVLTIQHANLISCVAWSPDSKRLATGWGDSTTVWDAQSGEKLLTFEHSDRIPWSVAWSPDGKRLATGLEDHTTVMWDAQSGEKLLTFQGHSGRVRSVAWSPDGKRLATASDDRTARVWDTTSGEILLTLKGHWDFVLGVTWSPDGKRLATGSKDHTARIWDAQSGERPLNLGLVNVRSKVSWSPDGKRLAMTLPEDTLVWDAYSGEKLLTLKGHSDKVLSVSWSSEGNRLATGSWDRTALIWDAQTGQKLLILRHASPVLSVSWSPDGKRLATGSLDRTTVVWDAQSGEKLLNLRGHSDSVWSVSWSPDGKRLATASLDQTALLWDAQNGENLLALKGHTNHVLGMSWSPDGKRLATASDDRTARVWDTTSGAKVLTFKGHSDEVAEVSWSPDGKRLATGSADNTAVLWDAHSGEKLLTLKGHSGIVHSASWSPDSTRLATGSWDGSSAIWNAESGQLLWQTMARGSDWISFTPQGYYHGSLAGEQLIRWRLPAARGEWPRLVAASQFHDTFYRPDLFKHLLDEGDVARALAAADVERGTRTTFTVIGRKQPPLVVITTPKDRARVGQAEVRVEAMAASAGDNPVTSLQLEVNGQPEGRILRVQQPQPGQVPGEWPRAPLRPGENSLRVLARAGGSLGYSAAIKVTYDTREQIKVRLHLLIIGVSTYRVAPAAGGYRNLRHAAADARRIRDVFVQQGRGLYDEIPEPIVLLDAEATRERIQDALQSFSERMGKDDMGVIFFAGHGDRHNDRLYLAAHDTRKDRLPATGISAAQLRDMLAAAKGRKYLFLDACHAGGVLQRSSGESIHEDIIRELRREAAGLVIATACRGSQKANEDEALGGYFAAALVEGLSGKGSSPQGVVRVKYLKLYVEERLRELTKALNADHQQEPLFDGPDELMDLPLARVRP